MTSIKSTIVLGLLVIFTNSGSHAQDCRSGCVGLCTGVRCVLGEEICQSLLDECETDCDTECTCLDSCGANCANSYDECIEMSRSSIFPSAVCPVRRTACNFLCGTSCTAATASQASTRIAGIFSNLYVTFVTEARRQISTVAASVNMQVAEFVSPNGLGGQAGAAAQRFVQRVLQSATDNGGETVRVAIDAESQAETAVRGDVAAIRAAIEDARENVVSAEMAIANQAIESRAAFIEELVAAGDDTRNEILAAAEESDIQLPPLRGLLIRRA